MSDCYYKKYIGKEKNGEKKNLFGNVEPVYKDVYEYVQCNYLGKQKYTENYFDGDIYEEEDVEKYLIEVDGKMLEVYSSEVFIK